MVVYRCDICKDVEAEKSVPDSWRHIKLEDSEDEGSLEKNLLACTACVSSFHAWLRQQGMPKPTVRPK